MDEIFNTCLICCYFLLVVVRHHVPGVTPWMRLKERLSPD
ncbi:hypothetical protein ACPOL_6625 [Acidisarcina polymorpha]|uniref:Uncharacterized protein n=1 Tax=Acidisarcina polymorpha TaxID=2211140 RepID=A0A2Z5GAE2_9BACT|nr:hypothetical protein ACPOL_6625 [Acidisarcina polymorpha]